MHCLKIVVLIVFVLLQTFAPANAFEEDYSPRVVDSANDWILYIDVQKRKEFLNYRGSNLNPITSLKVTSRKTPRHTPGVEAVQRTYEELWYHQGRALGSRRYNKHEIQQQKQGIIFVRPSEDALSEPRAVAHAAIKLTIELILKDIIVLGVVIPRDMYKDVVADMAHFGFQAKEDTLKYGGRQTSIYLLSHPKGLENTLYFQKWH